MTQTVLFIHGATVNPGLWAIARERFSSRYQCLAPTLPGHGRRSAEPFVFARALETLREAVAGVESLYLVGESLGGYLAMSLAAELGPRVRGLVVSGASSNFGGLAWIPWWAQKHLGHLLQAVLGQSKFEQLIDDKLERTVPARMHFALNAEGVRLAAFDEAVDELRNRNFLADVACIVAPILFVNGSRDRRQCWQEARFARTARTATTLRIPGAEHGVALWHAERFADLAFDYIESHAAKRGIHA